MGKGDKRSRRGKIHIGTWGKSRPRKRKKNVFIPKAKPKPAPKPETKPVTAEAEAAAPAAAKAKKPRAPKKTTKKSE